MKNLAAFGLWFMLGYYTVTKVAPFLQAKLEALDIDDMWEVWGGDERGEAW